MMSFPFFAYLSRMRFVRRWALMRNTEPENIQEHSHMVAVLAHALALIRNRFYGGSVNAERAALLGLYHDATEILTGDLPTPVKYHTPQLRRAYGEVEHYAAARLLSLLPEALREDYRPLLQQEEDAALHPLVKAADKLSAYIKCVEECRAGNGEFRLAAEQTREALRQMQLPEVDYFLTNCMESFSCTLDELAKIEGK